MRLCRYLLECLQLRSVGDVVHRSGKRSRLGRFRYQLLVLLRLLLHDQSRVVAKLSQVLQRLEDVLLTSSSSLALVHLVGQILRLGFRKLIVQLFLHIRQLAVVILNDLWGQVIQNILFQTTQQERKNLLVKGLESRGR